MSLHVLTACTSFIACLAFTSSASAQTTWYVDDTAGGKVCYARRRVTM